ncbi:hypothetical protein FHL15_011299 [Xylaria flabelliformis]|uniref:Uncharacterized protein n=1 Tax=Xylaria flabelliformis TaxID=2512241 RepID=A0A553HIP2_9PEZI|nr:hypothetical protein FHL15_011299 [Xylaria flabelliformis]
MNTRKKISLLFVFATGVAAISVLFKYRGLHGSSSGLTDASLSFLAEASIAIAVSCTPAIHNCWSKFVVTSTFYSRVSSAFSKQSLRGHELADSNHLGGSSLTQIHSGSGSGEVGDELGPVAKYWVDERISSDMRQQKVTVPHNWNQIN